MILSYKVYAYNGYKAYYMTINGFQFGPLFFTEGEVTQAINKIKNGELNGI